jgi:hypothetical protein
MSSLIAAGAESINRYHIVLGGVVVSPMAPSNIRPEVACAFHAHHPPHLGHTHLAGVPF